MLGKWICGLAIAVWVGGAWGHDNANGSGYFALEWPPDLRFSADGDDADWAWFDPVFLVDRAGLAEVLVEQMPAPDDFDMEIRTAWTREPDNRLLGFVRVRDDVLNIDETDLEGAWRDDELELIPDADHSGGPFDDPHGENAQEFSMHVRVPGVYETPNELGNFTTWLRFNVDPQRQWSSALIEADIGLTPTDAGHLTQNVVVDYEFAMPLWQIVGLGQQNSPRVILAPGKVIGFTYQVNDSDEGDRTHQISTSGVEGAHWDADLGSDYTLLSTDQYSRADEPTQVTGMTWGTIKQTFGP